MLLRSDLGRMQMFLVVRPNFAKAASVGAKTVRLAWGSATAGTRPVQLRAATRVVKLPLAIAMSAIVFDWTVEAGAAVAGPAMRPMTISAASTPVVRRRTWISSVEVGGSRHLHFEGRTRTDWSKS